MVEGVLGEVHTRQAAESHRRQPERERAECIQIADTMKSLRPVLHCPIFPTIRDQYMLEVPVCAVPNLASRPTKRQTHEERQELARLEQAVLSAVNDWANSRNDPDVDQRSDNLAQAVLTAYATLTEFYAARRIKPDAGGVQPAAAARRRR